MQEVWKDVIGYEGYYKVSSLGNIVRLSRECSQYNGLTGKFNNKILEEKLVVPCEDRYGYLRVKLNKSGERKGHMVHRLVAQAFIPNPENKPEVNHKKGDKKDNRFTELEWVTTSENQQHAHDNKLYECQKGETNGMAKLSEVEVKQIHFLYSSGNYTQNELAVKYDIAANSVSRILKGIRWNHVYRDIYGDK